MGPLRRCAVVLVLLLAAACGGTGADPDRVLSATGAASEEPPDTIATTTSSTATSTTVAPATTTTKKPAPATTTTTTPARRTQSTRVPVTPSPPIAGYSPAPPPPGVHADGYGGYGGFTEASAGGATIELQVYPREQYFGEMTQVSAVVTHAPGIAITSIKVDYGNGHVAIGPPTRGWYCDATTRDAWAGGNYVYPAAGTFRITATATFVACQGVPGMYIGPYFPPPAGLVGPWFPEPHQAVTVAMDVLQRADRPPPPVGPPLGP